MKARVFVDRMELPRGLGRLDVMGEIVYDGVETEFYPPAQGRGPGEVKAKGEIMRVRGRDLQGREVEVEIRTRYTS